MTKKIAKKKVSKKVANIQKDLPEHLIPVEMIPKESFDRLNAIHSEMIVKILEHYTALTRLLVHSITSIETMRDILKVPTDEDTKSP